MRRPRRTFSPEFRAKVAIAALEGDKTLAELERDFLEGALSKVGLLSAKR
jgi:transposase-like protein